jgi:hypothetical protein
MILNLIEVVQHSLLFLITCKLKYYAITSNWEFISLLAYCRKQRDGTTFHIVRMEWNGSTFKGGETEKW